MELLLIILLVLAVISLSGWGYGYYAYRPVAVDAAAPVSSGSPLIHLIGVVGLLLLVAFFVMWAIGGWHFGFQAVPPQ